MNSVARSAINSENALCLAYIHVTKSFGRSPAYRRLASHLSQSSRLTASSANQKINATSVFLALLRSQFHPPSIRVVPIAISQCRQFHVTRRSLQDEKPGKDSAKSASAGAEGPGSETRPDEEQSKNPDEGDNGEQSQNKEDGQKKKEDMPPPPPHGDKTPWQVFMETMNTEFQASKEWNESTKQIGAAAHQFTESESVRRAREAYEKSTGAISSTTARAVKSTAGAIGKGASWTWDTSVMKGVRKAANVTGDAVDKATKPIRDTEAYRNVKNVIDDGSSSRYGGWVEKEERRKRRAMMEQQNGASSQVMEEDPNAGTNITLHKDAAWKEAWRDFRDTNKFVQGIFTMKGRYEESENPLISTARSITDRIGGFFAENETALVIKKFRSMDPAFQVEPFLQELREYILPEVLDAYVKGDTETLKLWLSAAQFSVYEALTKQYLQAGMKSDGRILDIRNVDILRARMLDPGEVPVFIITCRTQEVHVYRNAKTNELAAGMEDKVQLVTYAIGITRVPEDVNNPETRGWRLIEMQKSGREWH
ncbi:mitochondrial inner membrane translocase subunit TIM44, putative [Metarhizium acridum CQMa 102]|uniref:Mitochondrial import inner membrane translocase subunit TIM44 n=1 Tax=Metarhizium acridum (strain CQMa 102) TaxID=655827 RepID=E9EEL6_METAQ|nr:mitochondrial inner membrane translocase subunit TIM44, putative [Metarhizium acridum CQMa 102]EFY85667.1 mitochondrial inner membrane translocase subunit TIM44, putative [Metarhizium acridum CQMa 102]